jgi:arylsulfatase A-like enzyme
MPSTPSSILDDRYSKGILLIAVLFFSWLLSVKSFVLDWANPSRESQSSAAPNILMIVVDDLGYDDTTAINSGGLPTPNLKQLAQEGVTFRRHYADSTCTPSRVAMLTGRYPERSGFRPVGSEIPEEFSTIGEQLRDAGYSTYLTGKWHAGEERLIAWPQNKGFDHWFGFLNQFELSGEIKASDRGQRKPTYRNPMLRENGGSLKQHSGHLTDILTDHTIQKLEALRGADKPWFLYHAFLAPHQPIQPAERYAEKFPDTPEGKYTALVTQLDDAIGRILQAIDRESTLVVFVSDNGGTNRERNNNFPFFGKKSEMFEGAFRTPLILSWPGFIPQERTVDDVVMNVDIYPTLLAAAKIEAPENLDGTNLWPLFLHEGAVGTRSRSWEVYSANVNTLSYSFLSSSGDWRLATSEGLFQGLFHLRDNPSGESNVASQYEESLTELTTAFWREHWRKSLIAVSEHTGSNASQTLFSGFDAMRTPYRHGFTIGLEIGPLPKALSQESGQSVHILAGQENVWELRFNVGQGLEWQMGNTILKDSHFEPSQCNAIILTGYFEPKGHLAKREPQSTMKLYSSGFLRDAHSDVPYNPADNEALQQPTFVNFHGQAKFSNMMLSSFADSYSPRLLPQFMELYTSAFSEQRLSIADVAMMDAELCK